MVEIVKKIDPILLLCLTAFGKNIPRVESSDGWAIDWSFEQNREIPLKKKKN